MHRRCLTDRTSSTFTSTTSATVNAGWLVGGVTGASRPDQFTLAAEFATRNIAVAAAIAVTLAGRVEFALFATTYFLTDAPLMLGAIIAFRRSRQPAS